MSDSPHDNDADSRPRVYKRVATKHGEVEVTVKGGEGETVDDIADEAKKQFQDAVDRHGEVRKLDEEPTGKGVN